MLDSLISMVAVLLAFVAIFINLKQIRESNNQFLFERRLEAYFILKELYDTFDANKVVFSQHFDGSTSDFRFALLCNNTYLETIQGAAKRHKDDAETVRFLIKMRDMKALNESLVFLFHGFDTSYFAGYIVAYSNVLTILRKCQILRDLFLEENEHHLEPLRRSHLELVSELDDLIKRERFEDNLSVLQKALSDERWASDMIKIRKYFRIS